MATTTQSNIKSVTRQFADAELFRGIIKLDDGNIAQFDPKVGGYALFFWTKMPPFMVLANNDLTKRFKNLTEKGATAFEGIQDLQVNTEDVTGGIAGNTFKVVSNSKDEFDTFTIKVYELQGAPIREAIEFWLTGVRDPKSGFAHYQGVVSKIEGGYCARNHTAELLYVETDPTGLSTGVEYACLITNIMPTKVPKSHLNFTHGDHGIVQYDLEFTGVKYESATINSQAKVIIEKNTKIEKYLEYNPKNKITLA